MRFRISTFTNKIKRKHDVGDPWRTPRVAVMMTVPRMLLVIQYIEIRAANITAPHPNSFRILNNIPLGTRSYALEKSMKPTYNFFLFFETIVKYQS